MMKGKSYAHSVHCVLTHTGVNNRRVVKGGQKMFAVVFHVKAATLKGMRVFATCVCVSGGGGTMPGGLFTVVEFVRSSISID